MNKITHPEWALKHKRKGTELRFIKGHYYLYQVSSKWNPEKKRTQKITGKILGKITPEGFIESKRQQYQKKLESILNQPVCIKSYGAISFIFEHLKEYIIILQDYFPDIWREIIVLTYTRLIHQSPLKNIQFHFENSFLSEQYSDITMTDKKSSKLLKQIGLERDRAVKYMRSFIKGGDYILADGTHLISHSQNMTLAKEGYNSSQIHDPQINLMFLFSAKLKLPVFYRILAGNIREVKSFKLTIEESGLNDVVIITDKGFYSDKNVDNLDSEQLKFIIPLRRNSLLINYGNIEKPKKEGFDSYFRFHDRFIWHYTLQNIPDKNVVVFYDEQMHLIEETDYLKRIETHSHEYSINDFHQKQSSFGTLAILTNVTEKSPEEIYKYYKSRQSIETMFDAMKNTLQVDCSYMQNEFALYGWMFINYLALQWYYHIYNLLSENKLVSKYSVKDLLIHLSEIRKVKINNDWRLAEITSKTQTLLKKLDIPIT
jgi:transposase